MRVLVYWHDMLLPHSAYLVQAFDRSPLIEEALLLGPRSSTQEAIFNQSSEDNSTTILKKTKLIKVNTYRYRPLWCTFSEYVKYISAYQPDLIIVVDEALSMNVLLAALAKQRASVSANVIFYGFDNIYSTVPIDYFRAQPSFKRLLTLLKKTVLYYFFDRALMPWRRKLVYGGLTSYQECTELVRQHGWYPVIKEQWWPINVATFLNPPLPSVDTALLTAIDGKYTIAFVGRFVEEKGIEDLIKAIQLLPETYVLLLVGAGQEQPVIEDTIRREQLESRIRVIPPQPQNRLAGFFQHVDLLVLPSRTDYFWKEQYGRALVEAMASQTLVLGSDSGAIPYVIGDPNLVVKEGDSNELAQKIEEIFAKQWHKDTRLLKRNQDRSLRADPQAFIKACCDL